jgi:hypothetical protein
MPTLTVQLENRVPAREADGTAIANGLFGLPALLLLGALAIAYAGQGGFYAPVQASIAGLLVAATVASWRARQSNVRELVPPWGRPALALCGWTVFSAAVNGRLLSAAGTVALIGGMAAIRSIASGLSPTERETLLTALLALGCVVAATGWIGLVFDRPIWVHDLGFRRASTSITYPNAAAGLLAILSLVAMARASADRSPAAHVGCCVLIVGTAATLSRGGGLAFGTGLVVLWFLIGGRHLMRALTPGLIGAAITLVGLIPAFTDPPTSPWPAVVALVAGTTIAGALADRSDRLLRLAAGVALTLTAIGATLPITQVILDSDRTSIVAPERHRSIVAALRVGIDHPVLGAGPGNAQLSWVDARGELLISRYAHNEYAQTFAETGVIGLALVLLLISCVFATLGHAGARRPIRPLQVGAITATAAFAAHSLTDFIWRLPAIPLTLAALVGLALPALPPRICDNATETNR